MAFKTIGISDDLQQYVLDHSALGSDRRGSDRRDPFGPVRQVANLQIAPEQAPFMKCWSDALGVRRAIEVGTFTGLSALSIARGLAAGGKLICCDISEEYTSIARRYWAEAGVADRDRAAHRPGRRDARARCPPTPHFDLAFIDADKVGYPAYWAEIVPRMRPGGVILVDNVLRGGRVVGDPAELSNDDEAMLAFNDMVMTDERVTVGDDADGRRHHLRRQELSRSSRSRSRDRWSAASGFRAPGRRLRHAQAGREGPLNPLGLGDLSRHQCRLAPAATDPARPRSRAGSSSPGALRDPRAP